MLTASRQECVTLHLPTQGTVYWSCSVASDPVLGSAIVVTSFCAHPSAASTACRAPQEAAD